MTLPIRPEDLTLAPSQQAMLHHIRKRGPLSRAEIGRLAKLSSGAVTRFGRELIDHGLIREEQPERDGRSGRPSQSLALRGDGGAAFGFAVHPGWLEAVLLDFEGRILSEARLPFEREDLTTITGLMTDFVQGAVHQLTVPRLFGAGVAVPGYVTRAPRHRHTVEALKAWRDVDLAGHFSSALGLPVLVENDASAAVLGEFYDRDAAECSGVLAITMAAGVGGGMVLDSRLVRGAHGNAGEIGWYYPYGAPRPSALDFVASLGGGASLRDLVSELTVLDEAARRWCARAGRQLVAVVNAGGGWFDPDRIVLTGPLPLPVLEETARVLAGEDLFEPEDNITRPVPVASRTGARAAAIGAGHLLFHALSFAPDF